MRASALLESPLKATPGQNTVFYNTQASCYVPCNLHAMEITFIFLCKIHKTFPMVWVITFD